MICLVRKYFLLSLAVLVSWSVSPAFAFSNDYSVFEAAVFNANKDKFVSISEERQAAAQKFVSNMGDEAIRFLGNDNLSPAQKKSQFRTLLNNNFDMNVISRFALGRNWKAATPAQRKEYQRLVNDMIVDVYSTRFNDYQGQAFEVRSSQPVGKKDYLVSSLIVPNEGQKVKVDWRVRDRNGSLKIIDVIVEGVSMTLTQRSEFASVIQRGGGNVDALIAHLKQ